MLELKNVCKNYKIKKGEEVKALNNISLKLPDTGMVFILGKSGSGKSTFLNVIGGLDSFDSGEIIINNRSSKGFSQSDFDSYRNTYIGFIFQEYNILDDISVRKNIKIALELQGKKSTEEEINHVLELVDLQDLGNRKPNELSGGQKQRVAIARAIIKNPEIIMADEPTGALDSNTGRQILTTLKKLSKEKLVLIVSHDREFAEIYADRIVEFKDGNIISDISANSNSLEGKINNGFEVISQNVIHISENHQLSQDEINLIIEKLKANKNETYISFSSEVNEVIKKTIQINDSSLVSHERFVPTKEEDAISESNKTFTSIKSKLSFKNSFLFGINSLKVKPFRLALVILLSCISFGLFGFVDTLTNYSKTNTMANSIKNTNIDYASFTKKYTSYTYDKFGNRVIEKSDGYLGTKDIEKLNTKFDIGLQGVYRNEEVGDFSLNGNLFYKFDEGNAYYTNKISGLIEADENTLSSLNYKMAFGRLPQNSDEIAITDYTYSIISEQGYYNHFDRSEKLSISQMTPYSKHMETNNLVINPSTNENRTIYINNKLFKLTGIIDTNFDFDKYFILKENIDDSSYKYLSENYQLYITYGYHNLGFICKDGLKDIIKNNQLTLFNKLTNYSLECGSSYGRYSFSNVAKYSQNPENTIFLYDGITSLNNNETIVPDSFIFGNNTFKKALDSLNVDSEDFEKYATKLLRDLYLNIENLSIEYYAYNHVDEANNYYSADSSVSLNNYISFLKNKDSGFYHNPYGKSGYEIAKEEKTRLLNKYKDQLNNLSFSLNISDTSKGDIIPLKQSLNIKGIFVSENSVAKKSIILSDSLYEKYVGVEEGYYSFVIGKMPKNINKIKKLINFEDSSLDTYFCLNNESKIAINVLNDTMNSLRDICFYVSIGLMFFSMIFLFNFISASINNKKHEIGILRAIGSRSVDVVKIFFSESIIIALINFLLSSILLSVCSTIANFVMVRYTGLSVSLFSPGIRQFGIMLLVSVFVAYISCAIPIHAIAKKKPINVIKER